MTATAWEEIERARTLKLLDEDGDPVAIEVGPPLTDAEIDEVARRAGVALPAELVDLLHHCSGLSLLERIDFAGRNLEIFGFEEAFPHALTVAHDGYGNYWVLDLTPETKAVAPVYFVCHDAPVVLYQSPDLATFVREVIRMKTPPYESTIDDVHEDRLFEVWRKNPGTLSRKAALDSSDLELKAFAETLDARFKIVDLRGSKVGMGFSWGRYGPNPVLRRHGNAPIFAYAATGLRGVLARLVG